MVTQNFMIGRKKWQVTEKVSFRRNMDSVLIIWGRKKNGTGKLGDWQENISSGRKCKVSSKYE